MVRKEFTSVKISLGFIMIQSAAPLVRVSPKYGFYISRNSPNDLLLVLQTFLPLCFNDGLPHRRLAREENVSNLFFARVRTSCRESESISETMGRADQLVITDNGAH